ncbi:MAG: sigma-70 family RNA polymerase sigma factor [Candidatus Limnocylindria bacterium]
MERIASGDESSLATLYERHQAVALRVAMRVVHDRGRAEDVLQDAFLSVWRKASSYVPGRGSVKSWLLGIVRNRAIDVARAQRDPNVDDEAILLALRDAGPNVADAVVSKLDAEMVRSALHRLPEGQRQAVTAAFFEDRSHAEIARSFEIPLGTIHGRVRLGLRRLHRYLVADGAATGIAGVPGLEGSAGFAAIMASSPPSPQNRAA